MNSKLRWLLQVALVTWFAGVAAAVAQVPSGERVLGNSVVEPAYDLRTGELIYIMTPADARSAGKAVEPAVSPLYIVVYPNSAAGAVGPMNCAHEGGENCPDHGPGIADLAQASVPAVYGGGVWGHDHVIDGPGGGAFNVTRQVVVVLFTNAAAATSHITTNAALDEAIDRGDAFSIVTPTRIHANVVAGSTYVRADPRPPAR